MHKNMKYINTLVILVFIISHISAKPSTDHKTTDEEYSDDYDEYYYEEEHSEESEHPSTTTTTTTVKSTRPSTTNTKPTTRPFSFISNGPPTTVPPFNCPKTCQCDPLAQWIDCAGRNLTQFPTNLPANTLELDISDNQLQSIERSNLAGMKLLRNLTVARNRVATIDPNAFIDLISLHRIDLSSNALTTLPNNMLMSSIQLQQLSLSHNKLQVPATGSLLVNVNLRELNLSACDISDLHTELFSNVRSLVKLDLSDNPLTNDALDVDTFTSMHKLVHLKVPELSEDAANRLCNALLAIDVISSADYDISCFELVSGTSFEESIIPRTTIAPIIVHTSSTAVPVVTSTTKKPNIEDNTNRRDNKPTTSSHVSQGSVTARTLSPIATGDATTMQPQGNVTSETQASPDTVNVSSQTINNILIAIIVFAVVGLLVGIVCRKDVCGIKTKMCRRSKRPIPPDQPQPAEEVPLNKV